MIHKAAEQQRLQLLVNAECFYVEQHVLLLYTCTETYLDHSARAHQTVIETSRLPCGTSPPVPSCRVCHAPPTPQTFVTDCNTDAALCVSYHHLLQAAELLSLIDISSSVY